MENNLASTVKRTVKNWWISLLVGIVCVAFGIWCIATPFATFLILSFIIAYLFMASGVFEIIFAISTRKEIDDWGWTLAMGIIELVFGVLLLVKPGILIYFLIFWVMFRSFWGIGISIDLQRWGVKGWGWLLLIAILGLVLSVILLMQPVLTGILASILFASVFVTYGMFRVILAFKLRSFKKFLSSK